MEIIQCESDIDQIIENSFAGEKPTLINSKITFTGKNNILYCEKGVCLEKSIINFKESNSVIYLSENTNNYLLTISIHYDSVLYFGINTYMQTNMRIILSEQKNVIIGDDGLFSGGIHMRVADPHLIYDCKSKKRLNFSKSIYIGDHVWLGRNAMILKGTEVGSGSIIGGEAVVPGKKIPSNTTWGGNPARQIAKDVYFLKDTVHSFRDEDTEKSTENNLNEFTYERKSQENILFSEIEENLKMNKTSIAKLQYLRQVLCENKSKNRFFV